MTSNGCCGLWMVGVWRWIPTGTTVILSRIGPVGSSRHSGSLGDLHCLCATCGTSAIFWIFWMIGTCDVKSAAVSSRQSSGFPGWSWTVSASLGAPSLYRLDCWYLVLRLLPMYWACGTHCLLSVVQRNGYIHSFIEGLRWLDERRLGVRDTLSQPSTRCRGLAATKN